MKHDRISSTNKECGILIVHEEAVAHAKGYLSTIDMEAIAEAGRLLSDVNRLKIIYSLLNQEKLCVCDLANIIEASVATTSHHLQSLKKDGILTSNREGRMSYYSLTNTSIINLLDLMVGFTSHTKVQEDGL